MKNKEKFNICDFDEAHTEIHYEDEAKNASLIMDNIVKSQKYLVEDWKIELTKSIDW